MQVTISRKFQGKEVHFKERGAAHNVKVDAEVELEARDIVECHSDYTLDQINRELQRRLPNKPSISRSTLARLRELSLVSLKKLEDIPAARNSEDTKNARQQYATWLLQEGLEQRLIFVDEAGINLFTRRTRGRAPVGQRATRVVGGTRGKNLTLRLAISEEGIVHYEFIEGGMTKDKFSNFLRTLSCVVGEEPASIICDNAPAHRNVIIDNPMHQLRHLPAYSPFLNPVENCFSTWKASLKRTLAEVRTMLMGEAASSEARLRGISVSAFRHSSLAEIGDQALETITPAFCRNWYRHMQHRLPECIRMDDISM